MFRWDRVRIFSPLFECLFMLLIYDQNCYGISLLMIFLLDSSLICRYSVIVGHIPCLWSASASLYACTTLVQVEIQLDSNNLNCLGLDCHGKSDGLNIYSALVDLQSFENFSYCKLCSTPFSSQSIKCSG